MDFGQLSIETIFIAIIAIFIGGAYVGGKVVTYLYHVFDRRSRRGRRYGRRHRDDRYDDGEEDEYSESSPFSFLVIMAILALFAFFIYMKTTGGWQSQLPVTVKRSLALNTNTPPRADSSALSISQVPEQNRHIYDPEYAPYTIGSDGEPEVPVAGDNEAGAYLIRVVTYSVWENALNTMTKLQNKGFPTGYWLTQGSTGDNFAVYVGPFRTYKNAHWFWKTQVGGKGIIVPAEGLELHRF